MPQKVRIALDAMGGDHGPSVVVPGAALALAQHPGSTFILFGDQARIEPLLAAHPPLKAACRLVHTDVAVRMDDKPSQALRNGRWKSSMWLAIDAVKKGEADVAVSAGNTGALMAMAKFNLKMLPGIERPAIAALWPTLKGSAIVLDLGATRQLLATAHCGLRGFRLLARARHAHRRHGVDRGVHLLDAFEAGLQQLDRGDFLGTDAATHFDGRQRNQLLL